MNETPAQSGHFEREEDPDVVARAWEAHGRTTALIAGLIDVEEHPSGCRCQRVCGGDQ